MTILVFMKCLIKFYITLEETVMKKLCLIICLIFSCFSIVACGGTNYPGNVKPKYWLSEDNTMMFYFPAESGRGNGEGQYLVEEGVIEDLILDFNPKTGVVDVKTSGYESIFSANTFTDEKKLICTFEIVSQEEGYNFPNEIVFNWKQTVNFRCLNNVHSWYFDFTAQQEGTLKELDYYMCNSCDETKSIITKNPTIDEFVTFTEINIPYDYFNQYELNEVNKDSIDFIRGYDIVSRNPNFNFEYGQLSTWYKENELIKKDSILTRVRNINDVIYDVNEFQSTEGNNSQYEQVIDGQGFYLNQNYDVDDALHIGTFETEAEYTFILGQRPADILALSTSEIKYEYRLYPDIEIVRISGKYNDSENRVELFNITFDITYLIKNNTIIAFLFSEKATNTDCTEYTEITEYCIPFTGELNLIDQESIDDLLK